MKRIPYVSLDIETTGLDPDRCQVLEVGAIKEDWESPLDQLSRFHCYVVHPVIRGEPYALAMHGKLLRTLANRDKPGLYLQDHAVGFHLRRWLEAVHIDSKKVFAAGKNFGSFDLQFLRRLPGFSEEVQFHHRSIDPAMLYWNPGFDAALPSTDTCMAHAELSGTVAHNAIDDALTVIKLIRYKILGVNPAPQPQILASNYKRSAKDVAHQLTEQFYRNGQIGT